MGVAVSQDEFVALRKDLRRQGKVTVFTNGCFDLLHPGHVRLFEAAALARRCLAGGHQ